MPSIAARRSVSDSAARSSVFVNSSASCPAGVRRRTRPRGASSVTPSASFNCRICIDTVGWVRCSAAAARVTPPCSATAWKIRSWCNV